MGTRLYPNTTDSAKLEKLAGVAEGTHARLKETQARHEAELLGMPHGMSRQDKEYEQWQEINNDTDLGALAGFLCYGWGKFKVPIHLREKCIKDGYLTPSGSLDGIEALSLMEFNGVLKDPRILDEWREFTIDDIGGGVHWC